MILQHRSNCMHNPLLDKLMSRNQYLIGVQERHLIFERCHTIEWTVAKNFSFSIMAPYANSSALGLIHTCDFLGVICCANFPAYAIAKNGHITHY